MAIPVTFLILFVSLVILISATYYFSMSRIALKTSALKVSGAEQEMLSCEKTIRFVSWAPGSYEIIDFDDYGGTFRVMSGARKLALNVTDNASFSDVFFDNPIGEILYELPPSGSFDTVFLKGDNRVIINQSSSTMSQLVISQADEQYEITLSYRPLAGSTVTGLSPTGRPMNNLQVYIINLNSSQNISEMGNFRAKVSCLNVTSSWRSYTFSSPMTSLSIKANLDGVPGTVSVPISSNGFGATVNVETVVCALKLEDTGW
jgi:hypothetical protein